MKLDEYSLTQKCHKIFISVISVAIVNLLEHGYDATEFIRGHMIDLK